MMISWNQELKQPNKIKSVEKNINVKAVPEDEQDKRRSDISFYRIEEKKDRTGKII
jgi:hypothetical protein